MKLRTDIVDMLRNGHSHAEIMRTLHVGEARVTAHRKALRMPAPRRGGHPLRPIAVVFAERTEPADGGHLRWTGQMSGLTPVLGRNGTSAYRIAFRLHYRREPVGYAKPGCGHDGCVQGSHLEDQPMRVQLRTQLASIFGGTS
ncbi:hypothetical protein ACIQRW_34065 [Streptomyces sp. NPDC091287]|uniref:hypothetical protein n=1 Tax=Streptomyces sp. NPDC091287 TaxID=3365988 RepID=UPI00381E2B50